MLTRICTTSIRLEKVHAVQKVAQEAVVAVTSRLALSLLWMALVVMTGNALAATLPPDAVDIMHHQYDGGGMKIDGPSVLVRKSIGPQVSITGHYYVDTISAASVDVIASGASKYEEERTETSGGIDFLYEKAIISAGYTNSSENDYEAETAYFGIAQDFFGDLTSVSFAYARGWDEVGRRGIPKESFEKATRHNYKLGVSQVLTKNALLGFDADVITDEGKLENPYRQNRFLVTPTTTSFQEERYPDTRTSTAFGIRALYYLPYRASIKAAYRHFSDTWEIKAHTYDFAYTHALGEHWVLEASYRIYTQDQAEFYSDLFPFENSQTHVGRDKELSTYTGTTAGFGVSYEIKQGVIPFVKRLQFSVLADYLEYEYDNFRDLTVEGFEVGQEPLYSFDAWVTRTSLIIEF